MKKFGYLASMVAVIVTSVMVISPVTATSPGATLVKKQGNVTVNGHQLAEGRSLDAGDLLRSNQSDTSFLDVSFPNGHKIRLKEATVKVRSLEPNIELELREGKAFSAYQSNVSTRDLRIRTKHSIAGVRGTKFFVSAKPDETYFCVCEGSVWVEKRGFIYSLFSKGIVVPAGSDAHIKGDGPMPQPQQSPGMVEQTWREFGDMGYELPERYQQ